MRAVYAILLFAFFGSFSSANADVIFSGNVSTTTENGVPCSASGSASSSFTLGCSSSGPTTTAMVAGSGNPFGGSLHLDLNVTANSVPPFGHATGTAQVDLDQVYVLAGGSGTSTVDFRVALNDGNPPNLASASCVFTFDGASQSCDLGAGFLNFSELVNYGVPFSIGFDAEMDGVANNGEPQDGFLTYSFSEPGLITTPEPSSASLLILGLVGMLLVRLRARCRLADSCSSANQTYSKG